MHPNPKQRPDVDTLLRTDRIKKILEQRRMLHRKIVSGILGKREIGKMKNLEIVLYFFLSFLSH